MSRRNQTTPAQKEEAARTAPARQAQAAQRLLVIRQECAAANRANPLSRQTRRWLARRGS